LAHARIESMNGENLPKKTLPNQLARFDLLHFLCHGEEGGGFGQSPALHLGVDERLELANVVRIPLERCALVVLQSCWTGWMDHRRTNPVQGFPQAFCDAGARAVIAPFHRSLLSSLAISSRGTSASANVVRPSLPWSNPDCSGFRSSRGISSTRQYGCLRVSLFGQDGSSSWQFFFALGGKNSILVVGNGLASRAKCIQTSLNQMGIVARRADDERKVSCFMLFS
jgi:CHAT domain